MSWQIAKQFLDAYIAQCAQESDPLLRARAHFALWSRKLEYIWFATSPSESEQLKNFLFNSFGPK